MIYISHRGNLCGKNSEFENNPVRIDECINLGFDVEIDLRYEKDKLFLGHDFSQYEITYDWILKRNAKLWIHCKDHSSINFLYDKFDNCNFFWHQNDDYTMTSLGFLWAYPGKEPQGNKCIMVLPELFFNSIHDKNCLGICTDNVLGYKNI